MKQLVHFKLQLFFFMGLLTIAEIGHASGATTNALTYQGRIVKTDGAPLEYSNVGFIFQITNGPVEKVPPHLGNKS